MVIGIVDLDLLLNRGSYQLNLDVMQISAYYKNQNVRVRLCPSMKLQDLSWYSVLYVIYNGDKEIFIDDLAKDSRTILIGRYFYRDITALPDKILNTYPDKVIYENLLRTNYLSKTRKTQLLATLHNADFIRIHEKSNLKFLSESSTQVIIYDLNITDADRETISDLHKQFALYYPIKIRTLEKGLEWIKLKTFNKKTTNYMFTIENLNEKDYEEFSKLSIAKRKMFCFSFGHCEVENLLNEFKRFVKFALKAKTLSPLPKIEIAPIQDPDFYFLFNITKKWYGGSKENLNISIFKYGFQELNHYKIMTKITASDPELALLLKSTLYTRYQDEQARKNYRRVD